MSYNTGYVDVAHATYDQWKNATLDNFYDYDGQFGCQCMDFAYLFWANVGFPHLLYYPLSSTGNADGVWNRRFENLAYNGIAYFTLVTQLQEVKKGDIICYSTSPYGHIGFANEDYNSWKAAHPDSYEFPILSENNGGTVDPQGGTAVNVHGYDIRYFQGAFRYSEWNQPVPFNYSGKRTTRLPLILAARRLINPNSVL